MTTIAEVYRFFADDVETDSPFYAGLARALAGDDELLARIRAVPPGRHHPTLPFAAVHDLVLGGVEHPIADVYRSAVPGEAGERVFLAACRDLWPDIAARIETRGTQTNEPNRAAVIRLALIAATTDPIALIDVGTSAGLNLILDRYGYDYGDGRPAGDDRSPLRLACELRGDHDIEVSPDPVITHRVGIDRAPVDARDPEQTRWLRACVWPDQPDRAERLATALDLLAADPPPIVRGDAVATLPDVLANVPDDALPVVTTTWAMAYFPKDVRTAFVDLLTDVSRTRPVAWVSCEARGVAPLVPAPEPVGINDSLLGLVRFENGEAHAELVGVSHPHGRWLVPTVG